MLKPQFPFHFFHAHGCALGGEITKPFSSTIQTDASTAISSVGGHATASHERYNLREVIRFERASTQIAAIKESTPDSHDTVVTCSLEKVNIFNQFTADEIVAHLSIKTSANGTMSFTTLGSRFVNLRVGGVLIHPVLEQERTDEYGSGRIINPVVDLASKTRIHQDAKSPGGFLTTLVSKLDVDSKHIEADGNAIYVPDFGVIYLAEYLVTPNARQLYMFRIQFGCGVDGRSSGGGVGANGSTCPPPPV